MMRPVLLSLVILLAGGCVQPAFPPDEIVADAAVVPPDAEVVLNCEPRIDVVGSGHHNPGTECLTCHNGQEVGAPIFSIGGTAYQRDGVTPQRNATIIVIDSNGLVLKLPTQQNGNFYAQVPIVPPLFAATSLCPSNVPMMENFVDGDCNSCHSGVDEPGRVMFP